MKATLITDKLTPIDPLTLMLALKASYFRDYTNPDSLSDAAAALFCAQSALETGRWKSIHCLNIGNIKAGSDYPGLYCQYRCNEMIRGKFLWFDPPHPQTNFRAYESLEDACDDYLYVLSTYPQFHQAFVIGVNSADPIKFVHALKQGNYFTAEEAPYTVAVISLQQYYLKLLQSGSPPTLPDGQKHPEDLEWDKLRASILGRSYFGPSYVNEV